jgi:hypothetical protein
MRRQISALHQFKEWGAFQLSAQQVPDPRTYWLISIYKQTELAFAGIIKYLHLLNGFVCQRVCRFESAPSTAPN